MSEAVRAVSIRRRGERRADAGIVDGDGGGEGVGLGGIGGIDGAGGVEDRLVDGAQLVAVELAQAVRWDLRQHRTHRRFAAVVDVDLVFVAYESPMAPGGGISPVLARLPQALRRAGARVSVVTPYHHRVIKAGLTLEPALPPVALPCGGATISAQVTRMRDSDLIDWYFVATDRDRMGLVITISYCYQEK